MNQQPGWYHGEGDPSNTERWWDGSKWIGEPQPVKATVASAAAAMATSPGAQSSEVSPTDFPGAPPAIYSADGKLAKDRSPLDWAMLAFKKYAQFDGRSSRAEFWWFQAFYMCSVLGLGIPGFMLLDSAGNALGVLLFILAGLVILASIIPGLAVTVRRLHDTDRSGAWMLIGMIPIVSYIGGFVLLCFYASEGDAGRNQYGDSPYAVKSETASPAKRPVDSFQW